MDLKTPFYSKIVFKDNWEKKVNLIYLCLEEKSGKASG